MEWAIVLSLIIVGIILILVEILFIPGTTFVGVLGFVSTIAGISFGFHYFSPRVAWMVATTTLTVGSILIYLSFTTGFWKRFALTSSIDSKVNDEQLGFFHVGDEGIACSTLKPIGKGEFNGRQVEVRTQGDFLEKGIKIKITQIQQNQITVSPI